MQFIFDDAMHIVVRVTGPAHNLLGIEFSGCEAASLEIEAIPSDNDLSNALRQEIVVSEVIAGLQETNERMGTRFFAKRIRYVPDDSYIPGIYKYLAGQIASRLAEDADFRACQTDPG